MSPIIPRADLNATQLQDLADAAHAYWNPPMLWLFAAFIFLSYLFFMVKSMFFPEYKMMRNMPVLLFTWFVPAEEKKALTGLSAKDRWMTMNKLVRLSGEVRDTESAEFNGGEVEPEVRVSPWLKAIRAGRGFYYAGNPSNLQRYRYA